MILNYAKAPAKKLKDKQNAELKKLIIETIDEIMPGILTAHDLETKDKYLADRQKYLTEISDEVLEKTMEKFNTRLESLDNIPELLIKLDTVAISAKDILREKIIKIYLANRSKRRMSMLDHERLIQFYKDYKALHGNSYIDKYYKRMEKWKVVGDTEFDDDDLV
jgi:hypothetical protein